MSLLTLFQNNLAASNVVVPVATFKIHAQDRAFSASRQSRSFSAPRRTFTIKV